jgi:hypothetical protein
MYPNDNSFTVSHRGLFDVDKLKKLIDKEAASDFPVRKISGHRLEGILMECFVGSE